METLLNEINKTIDGVLDILLKTDDTSLNKTPSENSWSIGQVIEHIIICGHGIPDLKTEETQRPWDEKVQVLKAVFLNTNEKYKADPSLSPRKHHHDKNELILQVHEMRRKLSKIVIEKDLNLLCLDMELPYFGFLTRYEWIHFILFHTQRHTLQARNTRDEIAKKG
jgi:hypothetical protein